MNPEITYPFYIAIHGYYGSHAEPAYYTSSQRSLLTKIEENAEGFTRKDEAQKVIENNLKPLVESGKWGELSFKIEKFD